jgi:hypothetical protein
MTVWDAEIAAVPHFGAGVTVRRRSEVRLRVKPQAAVRGYVDGAWWPRSHDPVAEFPGLVLATSSWVGPVRRVTCHPDDWDTHERELTMEGWSVSLAGSLTLEANTVVVTGANQKRMSLLVVPPGTPDGVARAVLRSAARPDTVAGAEEILASHGIRLGPRITAGAVPRPRVAEAAMERRQPHGRHS